ncbi:double-strand break repair helicase AddA [Varunaivibrio sulfuroxidans]|uniref:DNA 3'-5' helicase n=1 Tax=Varunaivibrio sulfuroxidans TaxID=1773489 RepID=A0A4V2UNE6_9PROT|nr:double-strand break repair helicase AddA [Varunaivibrio sulfuroxidans]TCS61641.1 DNA helicase/exodeoxyribonuclease V subunit A [Varunaivibrio sulfuroxidans]WES29487.1 double-strand break repair helicase AddA [Varunaivibrio sulfuroxidans]
MNTPSSSVNADSTTQAQRAAADPEKSVWVSANAGTGKTRVLIDRITRLLLDGTRPQAILCLTFTKTAAAEMAQRLNARLGTWAMMGDGLLKRTLTALLGRPPEAPQVTRARRLFADILDTPGGLQIRTLHSFCESLLGRFPIEAGVAPHFSVIDERTQGELLNEARDRLLARAFENPDGAQAAAVALIGALTDEGGFAKTIGELAQNRARLHRMIRIHGSLDALKAYVAQALGVSADDREEDVLRAALGDAALGREGLERACAALDHGTAGSQKKAAEIRAFLDNDAIRRAADFDTAYRPLFLTAKDQPLAAKNLITNGARAFDPDAEAILRAEQNRLVALIETLQACRVRDATVALLTVAGALIDHFDALKQRHALLDYDDLIDRARDLLARDGGASWVHYKLDEGLQHILVDESQDTSPAQWEIVRALADEFFSGRGAHEDDPPARRTIFAVGDEKQSIYSFQGAEPVEFARMQAYFARRARESARPFETIPLKLSFRSTRAVLSLVDEVFARPEARDGLSFAGLAVEHAAHRADAPGLVELWPVLRPEDVPESDPWDAPIDRPDSRSPEVRLAERIAKTIDGWLQKGETLEATGEAIRPGDILILLRKRTGGFISAMVRALKNKAIAVAGTDRMVLGRQIAVMDLLALARFAVLCDDDLNLAALLKSPLIGLDEATLFDLAHRRTGSLWAALGEKRRARAEFERAHDKLTAILARADFTAPYEFFASVLSAGGLKALLQRLGPDAEDPIDEFLSLALEFERTHVPSLQGFLNWFDKGESIIKRDMETVADEVRIMTVHGAKGLEAPIVFLPDTCASPDGRNDSTVLWRHEPEGDLPPVVLWSANAQMRPALCQTLIAANKRAREQEYRRLLYVAMTRARDRLYVCGWEGARARPDSCWYELVAPVMRTLGEKVSGQDDGEGDGAVWRYHTPGGGPAQKESPEKTASRLSPALPSWARERPEGEPTPPRPLIPTRPDDIEPPVSGPFAGDDIDRYKRGKIIHRLLEILPTLPRRRRPAAAARYLDAPLYALGGGERDAIIDETLGILDDPRFAFVFGPGSMAEVALSGVVGGRVLSARVDRLLVREDAVWVVDYKTNRPPPKKTADTPPAYLRQMAAYRACLKTIFPGKTVHCLLLWTHGPFLSLLDENLTAPYAPTGALDGIPPPA